MNVLFEALYLLEKDTYFKKLYYLTRCFSALTTAQIVVNSQFSWASSSTAWLQNILLWLSFPVQNASLTQYYWLLAFAMAFVLATAGLFYLVCRQILAGTMENQRLTQALRLLMGLLLMLSNPILNILLASFNCDWVGGSYLSLNWDTTESCTTSTPRVILMCVSAVAFVPLMGLVLLSALMHISDPKSGMALTRAHSRVELASVAADAISNGLFGIVNGYKGLLAAIYIALQLSVVASYIVFQPFYHGLTNDVFTMLAAVPLWAGLALAVLLGLSDDGSVASVVLLAGVAPFGLAAFWASRRWRSQLVEEALREHDPSPQDEMDVEVLLSDEEVFPVLREKYDRNSTTFFMLDVRAALVEVKTRFLVEEASGRGVAVAENILKKGLLEYPQSEYLRLQYVSFLLYHRNNPLLASVRLDEVLGLNLDLDVRFSLLRMRREVDRIRHVTQTGTTGLGSDSLSLEDVKNKIKSVRALHRRAIELTEQVWKTLARKKGGGGKRRGRRAQARRLLRQAMSSRVHPEDGSPKKEITLSKEEVWVSLTPLVEELEHVIRTADKEYAILWAQCRDSKEVGAEYARYLRNIKKDTIAADEIEDQLAMGRRGEGGSQSGDDRSSRDGASSTGSATIQTVEQQQRRAKLTAMTETFARRISAFKLRLRGVSFVLVAAAICSFVVFYMLSSQVLPIFDSFLECGSMRTNCGAAANRLRQMHTYALQKNEALFNRTRSTLNSTCISWRSLQYGLMSTYRTNYAIRNDYRSSQTIEVRRIGSANSIGTETISPDELVLRMIDYSLEALNQPMSKFAAVSGGTTIQQFPAFFFVMDSAFTCVQTVDTIGEMYRMEIKEILGHSSQVLSAMLFLIVFTEVLSVTLLIRPTVNKVFANFAASVFQFSHVPLDTAKELSHAEAKHLARFRVLAGDDQMSEMEQADDLDCDIVERRESPQKTTRRVRLASIGDEPSVMSTHRQGSSSTLNLGPDSAIVSSFIAPFKDDASSPEPSQIKRPVFSFHDDLQSPEVPTTAPDAGLLDFGPPSALRLASSELDIEQATPRIEPESPAAATLPQIKDRESRRNSDSTEVETVVGDDDEEGENAAAAAAPTTFLQRLWRGLRPQNDETKTSKRKLMLMSGYVLLLVAITVCISVITVLGNQATSAIVGAAASNINGSRRRSFFYLANFLATEYFYSNHAYSLVGSGLTLWTPQDLACKLRVTASLGLMLHYGILYGTEQGFEVLPAARNLPSLETVAGSVCSPATPNVDYFHNSIQMEGSAENPLFSNFYFVVQCSTLFDFSPNSAVVTDPRIYALARSLTPAACSLYNAGQANNGYHRLLDSSYTTLLQVALSNVTTAADRAALQPTMNLLLTLQDTDVMTGGAKVVFIAMGYGADMIASNQNQMAAVFAVLMFAIFFQHIVLGIRVEKLLKNDLSVTLMCDRMLENAKEVMKKQGYSANEIRKLMLHGESNHSVEVRNKNAEADSSDDDDDDPVKKDFVGLTLVPGSTPRNSAKLF